MTCSLFGNNFLKRWYWERNGVPLVVTLRALGPLGVFFGGALGVLGGLFAGGGFGFLYPY